MRIFHCHVYLGFGLIIERFLGLPNTGMMYSTLMDNINVIYSSQVLGRDATRRVIVVVVG